LKAAFNKAHEAAGKKQAEIDNVKKSKEKEGKTIIELFKPPSIVHLVSVEDLTEPINGRAALAE